MNELEKTKYDLECSKKALLALDRALTMSCMDFGLNSTPGAVEQLKKDYIDIATYDLIIEGELK
jgi:hypothetical protein